jgi:NAD+ kinase
MLRIDPRNRHAEKLADALGKRLDMSALPEDLCVVVGGDGWMLETIRNVGPGSTFLGINAGRTGFLLNDAVSLDAVAEALRTASWRVWDFPRLQMQCWPEGGESTMRHDAAVNDIYLERMSGQTAHLMLEIDGVQVVERLVCDGLVTSTALGSTAYHFSSSGHACHPAVQAIHLAPICAHAPRLAPLTLPPDSVIHVEVLHSEKRPVRAVSDGVDHGQVRSLRVQQDSQGIRLAFLEGHDFTGALVRKILKP